MSQDDSGTSSEDEERIAMLREKGEAQEEKHDEKKQLISLPSLRPDKQKDISTEEQFNSYCDLTKGAKDFVAKKLSEYLESELDTSSSYFNTQSRDDSPEEGIRLFSTSKELTTDAHQEEVKPRPRRRKISSSDDSSSEDERLNEAAVSHDFIIQQSHEVIPSNRAPADMIITNSGEKQTEKVHPSNGVPAHTMVSNTDDSFVTVNGDRERKKNKKKKKLIADVT